MNCMILTALLLTSPALFSNETHAPAFLDRSAQELYLANCASCHGVKGDGQGTAQLERRARSFVDGGFSYGNTPEAIRRTLLYGIPGTPMPAWKDALTEEQIAVLADYVIELGPGLPPAPSNTELVIADRPMVVRGHLPPISSSAETQPRGLLLGMPNGFSFEYRTDDLRLLGMRQGRFVDRTDWVGRGGTALKPLGPVVLLESGGAPPPTFVQNSVAGRFDLRARLRGTRVQGDKIWVQSQLLNIQGQPVAEVEETIHSLVAPFGSGYERVWRVRALDIPLALEFAAIKPSAASVHLESLPQWRTQQGRKDLRTAHPALAGEILWLLPDLPIAVHPGQRTEFVLGRIQLTLEAQAEISEGK